MGKYVVYGTVYHEYQVTVEADDKDTAREIAEGMPLSDWFDGGRSGIDIYDVEVEE